MTLRVGGRLLDGSVFRVGVAALVLGTFAATPAQAALVYDAGWECSDALSARPDSGGVSAWKLMPPCVPAWDLGDVRAGDAERDATGGAPEGEYIDLVTGIVYRYDGATLSPVGVSAASLGYTTLKVFGQGQLSGDPTTDVCLVGAVEGAHRYCGTCPSLYCMSFRVAVVGEYRVTVRERWSYWSTPDCTPTLPSEETTRDYGRGGVVTNASDYIPMVAPFASCGTGLYEADLALDGTTVDHGQIVFGVPQAPLCTDQVVADAQRGVADPGSCAPCWDKVEASVAGARHTLLCAAGVDVGAEVP